MSAEDADKVLAAWEEFKRKPEAESGVDLTTIGAFALVGVPYSLKFLWAPVLDRYTLPFLGRRRGWILLWQVFLVAAIAAMGLVDPKENLALLAAVAELGPA